MQQKTPQQPIHVLLLGAPQTGKTKIAERWVSQAFHATYQPTIGVSLYLHAIHSKEKSLKVILQDASGAKCYRSLIRTHLYDKSLSAIGLVFDGSVPLEEKLLLDWLRLVQEQTNSIPFFFLFNKWDLIQKANRTQQKELLTQKVQAILAQNGLDDRSVTIHFCSAKTGEGIEAAFFEALFANRTKKENSAHKTHSMILAPQPVSVSLIRASPSPLLKSSDS